MSNVLGLILKKFLTEKLIKGVVIYLLRELASLSTTKIDDGLVDIVEEAL